MEQVRIAFFDVDETLISVKSMFHFLRFFLRARGWPPERYESITGELSRLAAAGVPREETNRHYYRSFAGEPVELVRRLGEDWFRAESSAAGFFHTAVAAALQRHRDHGDLIVLVSGSFRPCLDPIARHVGADRIECTELTVVQGKYTGTVVEPVIGMAKAKAVARVMAAVGVDRRNCVAYGDHISDLAMLAAVATPVVVGADEALTAHAVSAGWHRLAVDPIMGSACKQY
jgi:HAD superfamily hydrolase (TIGR01490 family)